MKAPRSSSTSNHHQHGAKVRGEAASSERGCVTIDGEEAPLTASLLQEELNWHRVSRNQCVEGERATALQQHDGGCHLAPHAAAAEMDRLCFKCGSGCSRERCPSCGATFEDELEAASSSTTSAG